MNSSPFSRSKPAPRLRCRCVRAWCALGGAAAEHLAQCADCRAHFAAGDALDAALRRDAAITREAADPQRVRGILLAVRAAAAAPQPEKRRAWSPLWPLALGAATAAAIVGFALRSPTAIPPGRSNSTAEARVLAETVKSLSTNLVESVLPSAGEMVANNPMQQELDAIYADAKSAWGFLALNFVPSAQRTTPGRSG